MLIKLIHKISNKCCFTTAGRSQKCDEFVVADIQINMAKNTFPVKFYNDILKSYNGFIFHSASPFCGFKSRKVKTGSPAAASPIFHTAFYSMAVLQ